MTDKPQPQVVECYALRGDNGSFLFNQALRTEDDARAQRSQNIQFAVNLKVEPTQWEIIPSILVPRAEYERLQSEIEAANARIASMPRCNICGGDVVFNGGEPVEGMWGHRK